MVSLSRHLSGWENSTFGNVKRGLKGMKELERLRSDPLRMGPSYEKIKIVDRLVELNHREEIMWKQRSRINRLAEGDKNTRFFHIQATQRRRRNKISRLKLGDGSFTEDEEVMVSMTMDFYKTLYTAEGTADTDELLHTVLTKVTGAMNNMLLKPISSEEVKNTLFQMFPTKALGPDGFLAHFFQRHWDLCGEEVTAVVLRVLRGDDDLARINNTNIVLIPKVEKPEELGQF
ncbi:unnamed protein product [Miscanthus lutarioriparius]|uniref:Uncharacterized protein n=1 Tax=Miscanthus lutarioriparius TaxID=422564 RepID=A0A811RQW2_9POAL|nr:unnamed protein product [Miscanthus lutarioriparius]